MHKLASLGRLFFALALVALGIEHFIFRQFVAASAPPWPASIPGGAAWAYATGGFVIAVGLAIILGKHGRLAAVLAGALFFAWAFLRQVPLAAADSVLGPTWTQAARALKMAGGAWAIAASLPAVAGDDSRLLRFINRKREFVVLGRVGLAGHMIVAGLLHFKSAEFVAALLPGWFPGDPVLWTYSAGAALIAGGIGINVPLTARVAALLSGLMIFSWVWIVHLPRMFQSVSDSVSIFGALASAGIGFVLAESAGDGSQRAY
jgi:uncharacterized membrane protein